MPDRVRQDTDVVGVCLMVFLRRSTLRLYNGLRVMGLAGHRDVMLHERLHERLQEKLQVKMKGRLSSRMGGLIF